MEDPLHEPLSMELGGKLRELHFEHADFAVAERRLNRPLLGPRGIVEFWAPGHQADMTAALLFVGVCRRNPKLTQEQVYEWINFDNEEQIDELIVKGCGPLMDRIKARIERAMKAAEGEPEKEAEVEPEAPLANETGGAGNEPSPVSTSD